MNWAFLSLNFNFEISKMNSLRLTTLDKKTRAKVDWTIKIIEHFKIVPTEYFQRISGTDRAFANWYLRYMPTLTLTLTYPS